MNKPLIARNALIGVLLAGFVFALIAALAGSMPLFYTGALIAIAAYIVACVCSDINHARKATS